jgi:hypothetical protein
MAEASSSKITIIQVKQKEKLIWAQVVALPCNKANNRSLTCTKEKSTQLDIKSNSVQIVLKKNPKLDEKSESHLNWTSTLNSCLHNQSFTTEISIPNNGKRRKRMGGWRPLDVITAKGEDMRKGERMRKEVKTLWKVKEVIVEMGRKRRYN